MNTAFLNVRGRPQNAGRDMANVIPFRRATEIVSYTNEGVTSPVRNVDELFARITAWREYGDALHLRSSDGERAASVICLGDEGHVLTITCPHRWTKPWVYSEIVTRVAPDRSKPSLDTRDQWHSPDETTDLAGSMFFEDHIHGNAREIAQAAWTWLMQQAMLQGFTFGKRVYDPVLVGSLEEGIAFINEHAAFSWPEEASRAASDLAATLNSDRILVTDPEMITVRVSPTEPRVRFILRGYGPDTHIRAYGLTDDLGRRYWMRLPEHSDVHLIE